MTRGMSAAQAYALVGVDLMAPVGRPRHEGRTLHLRISDETLSRIEKLRGSVKQADFVRDLIDHSLKLAERKIERDAEKSRGGEKAPPHVPVEK